MKNNRKINEMKYDDPMSVILYSWQKENNKNKLEYAHY